MCSNDEGDPFDFEELLKEPEWDPSDALVTDRAVKRSGVLVLLSGPSGIGKTPLYHAFKRHFPKQSARLRPLVLYNSRPPRPGEVDGVDYHFRSRDEVHAYGQKPGYLLVEARNTLQALEVDQIDAILQQGEDPFFEGNPRVVEAMRQKGLLKRFPSLSIFLSPLDREEIAFFNHPSSGIDVLKLITEIQRRKLLHRARRMKGDLSLPDLEEVETRCGETLEDLREAWKFDLVLSLYDGEAHDHWHTPFPIGSARRVLLVLSALLRRGKADVPLGETWPQGLIPP